SNTNRFRSPGRWVSVPIGRPCRSTSRTARSGIVVVRCVEPVRGSGLLCRCVARQRADRGERATRQEHELEIQRSCNLHEAGGLRIDGARFDPGDVALGEADALTEGALAQALAFAGGLELSGKGRDSHLMRLHIYRYLRYMCWHIRKQ